MTQNTYLHNVNLQLALYIYANSDFLTAIAPAPHTGMHTHTRSCAVSQVAILPMLGQQCLPPGRGRGRGNEPLEWSTKFLAVAQSFPAGHSWPPVCLGGSYITQRDDQPDLPLQIYQPEKAQEGRRDIEREKERETEL